MNPLSNVRIFKHRDGTTTIRLGEHQVVTRVPAGTDPTSAFNAAIVATAKAEPARTFDPGISKFDFIDGLFLTGQIIVERSDEDVLVLTNGTFLYYSDEDIIFRTVDYRPFLRHTAPVSRSIKTANETLLSTPLPEVVQHLATELRHEINLGWARIKWSSNGVPKLAFKGKQTFEWFVQQLPNHAQIEQGVRTLLNGVTLDVRSWDGGRNHITARVPA